MDTASSYKQELLSVKTLGLSSTAPSVSSKRGVIFSIWSMHSSEPERDVNKT